MLGTMLMHVEFAQPRLGGGNISNRLLGRWLLEFDEPCISGPILYGNPAERLSLYDENLRQ